MNKKNLVIVGITGRMGQEIQALAPAFLFAVSAGIARTSGQRAESDIAAVDPNRCDVVVDFSQPAATEAVLDWCVKNRKPLVSGVTGHSERERQAMRGSGKKIAVFWAPNMSLGVAVMARMMEGFRSLANYDFQIEELHHQQKKDRPSGTALLLQQKLTQVVKTSLPAPVSIRGGGIFGIHRVFAMGEEETLTLEHVAMSRRVFARGALTAASWLIDRDPGFYEMGDLLDTL